MRNLYTSPDNVTFLCTYRLNRVGFHALPVILNVTLTHL